jgi:beta-aspartyl-peptidase (threonine type)
MTKLRRTRLLRTRATIIVHSGAGSGKFPRTDARFRELKRALEAGRGAMRSGSSLDGVVAAVSYMEDTGVFNAGQGSCLAIDGRIELDAAVMRGDNLKGAGVGLVTCTYHPVALARWLAENTRMVLVAGDECKSYARAAGMEQSHLKPSEAALARFLRLKEEGGTIAVENGRLWRRIREEGDTVGAVAVDSEGIPSAAVSTGGMWLKLPGRIGDSAILGAGIYADCRGGAACATGTGEEIIRHALCLRACEFLRRGDASSAARRAIALITRRSGKGTAGIITVDMKGRVAASYNTEAMGRAWYDHSGKVVVRI